MTRAPGQDGPSPGTRSPDSAPLRILMVAAEAAPFAKVGGLGDVIGSLPGRLVELGLEVTVVLPLYRDVRRGGYEPAGTGRQVVLRHGGVLRHSPVLEKRLSGVRYWFIREDDLYDRDGVYGPPGGEYADSALRYSYLCRASVAAAREMAFDPHIVHCHDWHAALTQAYMRSPGDPGPPAGAVKSVLTIHNLAYQGVFPREILPALDLPPELSGGGLLDHGEALNFLKAGLESADLLTTVSPTYSQEIQSPDQGCGLDGILHRRKDDLVGILNGIDYEQWDPGNDPCLQELFTVSDTTGRSRNREALVNLTGLSPDPGKPVIAFVGRLVHQKGADVLLSALPHIVREGFQTIVLGAGDPVLEESLRAMSSSFPGKVSVTIGFDDSLARRIYAGSDFFLMPSRFEPCGLGQMIAMRYGSVPVVRATGGLRDTVTDFEGSRDGTGILFQESTVEDLLGALRRAGNIYDSGRLGEIVPRIMARDNSWRLSARRYAELYSSLVSGREG